MVEDEALKAEAESPDDDGQDEDEEAAEAEAEDAGTPGGEEGEGETEEEGESPELAEARSIEKQDQDIAQEMRRHLGRLKELMPDFEDVFTDCPLCSGFGHVAAAPFVDDPGRAQCQVCQGRGSLKTGSLVRDHMYELCNRCNGNGWVTQAMPPAIPAPSLSNAPLPSYNGPGIEDPEVARLRAAGYIISPPISVPPPQS